jgi:hypothetical protein
VSAKRSAVSRWVCHLHEHLLPEKNVKFQFLRNYAVVFLEILHEQNRDWAASYGTSGEPGGSTCSGVEASKHLRLAHISCLFGAIFLKSCRNKL